jgi:hypothetical protein
MYVYHYKYNVCLSLQILCMFTITHIMYVYHEYHVIMFTFVSHYALLCGRYAEVFGTRAKLCSMQELRAARVISYRF